MDEEKKEEETQETPETQGTPGNPGGAPESDGASSAAALEAIKAELEEERQAKTAAETALAEKDALISDLQAQLAHATQGSDATTAELTQVKDAHTRAVAKYLDAVKLANPTIPGEVIAGDTIEAIDTSVAKATAIAGAVKASLEAQAKETRVPAGAPPRGEIAIEGLSPKEKIAAGIKQKGG